MFRTVWLCTVLAGGLLCAANHPVTAAADDAVSDGLQAGSAAVVITPPQPMWMAGYASRNKPAEGTLQDLYAKALAVEDATGNRAVIITCDLIGIPRALRERLEATLHEKYALPPESLLLNASHTHSGPELRARKAAVYELGADRIRQAEDYQRFLIDRLVDLVDRALDGLAPATLTYQKARCGFAMNRRLPTDSGYRNSPNPEGPVDHDVPVLTVRDAEGTLKTILFGYACHNTTLGIYQFNGDYAGYAQEYLEAAHPGVTAMFMLGCGGDQNPYPRRTVELAQQHGRTLANAVEAALETPPHNVSGPLRTAMEQVTLQFAEPASREELQKQQEDGNKYVRRHATLLLDELDRTGTIRTEYEYPVQAIAFGDDLLMYALAGETVVDYSLKLKRQHAGENVWVAGYSNDVFGYVPSLRVLREGGYEGGGAFVYTAFPGPFDETVEERITAGLDAVTSRVWSSASTTSSGR
ncbi:neutral/alkaline non-lysosomal ceramidase N-terminal domain-containing protein [Maioricimonas sp. JC845]|uniref:neutral/alkaline non-lysosomal ceramidase N-terminal domain-containing protein n=1 Tax=Maioricimonas sp. JC845 TaxID=3232138 RepID=UPI003457A9BB